MWREYKKTTWAYFSAKYKLDRSDTPDMDETSVTQRLWTRSKMTSDTSMTAKHNGTLAHGPHASRLLSLGILQGSGLLEQALRYLWPEERGACTIKTVSQKMGVWRRSVASWIRWTPEAGVHWVSKFNSHALGAPRILYDLCASSIDSYWLILLICFMGKYAQLILSVFSSQM